MACPSTPRGGPDIARVISRDQSQISEAAAESAVGGDSSHNHHQGLKGLLLHKNQPPSKPHMLAGNGQHPAYQDAHKQPQQHQQYQQYPAQQHTVGWEGHRPVTPVSSARANGMHTPQQPQQHPSLVLNPNGNNMGPPHLQQGAWTAADPQATHGVMHPHLQGQPMQPQPKLYGAPQPQGGPMQPQHGWCLPGAQVLQQQQQHPQQQHSPVLMQPPQQMAITAGHQHHQAAVTPGIAAAAAVGSQVDDVQGGGLVYERHSVGGLLVSCPLLCRVVPHTDPVAYEAMPVNSMKFIVNCHLNFAFVTVQMMFKVPEADKVCARHQQGERPNS